MLLLSRGGQQKYSQRCHEHDHYLQNLAAHTKTNRWEERYPCFLEWTVPLSLENVQQNVSASALFAQFPPDSCTWINAYVYKCMWPLILWSCSYFYTGIHPLSLLRLTKLWADVPKLLRVVVGRRRPRACWVNSAEEPLVVQNKICTWERRGGDPHTLRGQMCPHEWHKFTFVIIMILHSTF